jgi:hypothetical protein
VPNNNSPEVLGWISITSNPLFLSIFDNRIPRLVSFFIPPKSGGSTRNPRLIRARSHALKRPVTGLLKGASMAITDGSTSRQAAIMLSSVNRIFVSTDAWLITAKPVGLCCTPVRSIPTARAVITFLSARVFKPVRD